MQIAAALWHPGLRVDIDPTGDFKAGIVAARVLLVADVGVFRPVWRAQKEKGARRFA